MTDQIAGSGSNRVDCTAQIVVAYVSHNHVVAADLPALISYVHTALASLGNERSDDNPTPVALLTSERIRKSITPEALISFIDGKPYKVLKRHLRCNGLNEFTYRTRYGLPINYPMVSSAYSARRSIISKSISSGRHRSAWLSSSMSADERHRGRPPVREKER